MLPGTKRKLRLLVDWNIQLLFGRDASELGGLGRAPGSDGRTAFALNPAANERPEHFRMMQYHAMRKPMGWAHASMQYEALYRLASARRRS